MNTTTDTLETASHTLDRMAARLETVARAWREEADYMRNGDRSLLGTLDGREERYADAASRSLLRGTDGMVDTYTVSIIGGMVRATYYRSCRRGAVAGQNTARGNSPFSGFALVRLRRLALMHYRIEDGWTITPAGERIAR